MSSLARLRELAEAVEREYPTPRRDPWADEWSDMLIGTWMPADTRDYLAALRPEVVLALLECAGLLRDVVRFGAIPKALARLDKLTEHA